MHPSRTIAPVTLALALALGGVACSDDGGGTSDAATSTTAAGTDGTTATDGSADQAATVSANDASAEEIAAALDAAGVANADRWADEVVEYRPYDDADQGFPRLREELAKYNPPEGTIDQIIAVLAA